MTKDEWFHSSNGWPVERVITPDRGAVYVRLLTAQEHSDFEIDCEGGKNLKNFLARLCVKLLADEKGNRVFADEDAELLGKTVPARTLRIVFEQGRRFNALTDDDLDDLVKNLGEAKQDASPSPLR